MAILFCRASYGHHAYYNLVLSERGKWSLLFHHSATNPLFCLSVWSYKSALLLPSPSPRQPQQSERHIIISIQHYNSFAYIYTIYSGFSSSSAYNNTVVLLCMWGRDDSFQWLLSFELGAYREICFCSNSSIWANICFEHCFNIPTYLHPNLKRMKFWSMVAKHIFLNHFWFDLPLLPFG